MTRWGHFMPGLLWGSGRGLFFVANCEKKMAVVDLEERILVTGEAGFIGTHTVLQLLKQGFKVSIIDNFDNSVEEAVVRVRQLAGPQLSKNLDFHPGGIRNKEDLEKIFSSNKSRFSAVINFAGLKAVGESVEHPFRYFDNNLLGSINLYKTMDKYNCKKLVFSSSATVYGQPEKIPCVQDFDLKAMNPYGRTKMLISDLTDGNRSNLLLK